MFFHVLLDRYVCVLILTNQHSTFWRCACTVQCVSSILTNQHSLYRRCVAKDLNSNISKYDLGLVHLGNLLLYQDNTNLLTVIIPNRSKSQSVPE